MKKAFPYVIYLDWKVIYGGEYSSWMFIASKSWGNGRTYLVLDSHKTRVRSSRVRLTFCWESHCMLPRYHCIVAVRSLHGWKVKSVIYWSGHTQDTKMWLLVWRSTSMDTKTKDLPCFWMLCWVEVPCHVQYVVPPSLIQTGTWSLRGAAVA